MYVEENDSYTNADNGGVNSCLYKYRNAISVTIIGSHKIECIEFR